MRTHGGPRTIVLWLYRVGLEWSSFYRKLGKSLESAITVTALRKPEYLCLGTVKLKVTSILDQISETQAENIGPWSPASFFFFSSTETVKRSRKPHPVWQLLCSVSETNSPCSGGVAGREYLALTFKWMYQLSLWAAEFLYLMLPQQAVLRCLSESLWAFLILTVAWKEPTMKTFLWKEKSIISVFEALKWVLSTWIKHHKR